MGYEGCIADGKEKSEKGGGLKSQLAGCVLQYWRGKSRRLKGAALCRVEVGVLLFST
mgnify:FL=1